MMLLERERQARSTISMSSSSHGKHLDVIENQLVFHDVSHALRPVLPRLRPFGCSVSTILGFERASGLKYAYSGYK